MPSSSRAFVSSARLDSLGNILAYNADDDNASNSQDRTDPAPFRQGNDPNGAAVNDDELEPVRLTIDPKGADLTGYTLHLEINIGNVALWASQDKQAQQTSFIIGTHAIPGTIWVEGFNHGRDWVDFILKDPAGCEIHRDTVLFTVLQIDIVAYRPQTEGPGYGAPFARRAIPWEQENAVGIRRNGDDDNGNSVADRSEAPVAGENDAIEAELISIPAAPAGVEFVLSRSNANIKVWTGSDKSGPILDANNSAVVSLGSVWVDWVDGAPNANATLTLTARAVNTGNSTIADSVTFVPFVTVVIALGGEGQAPTDPAAAGHGLFAIAIDEYVNGYDVHMYDEDAVDWFDGDGLAWDEVVNAVNNRGVTQVVIFGYSHGGGATYQLAERLQLNPGGAITNPFTVPFTSYIDGITSSTGRAENRRPPLSLFHTGQYQTNTVTPLPLNGGPSGGDDDIDRSYLGVDDWTIDDHATVSGFLKMRLEQKVPAR